MQAWTLDNLAPPHGPVLGRGDVHLWTADVDAHVAHLARVQTLLAPAEVDRAARFYFEPDRQLYIVAHGLLRALLAAHLGVAPLSVQFVRTSYGKPVLAQQPPDTTGAAQAPQPEPLPETQQALTFNLSHSGRHVLFGLARYRALGVDVETHKPLARLDDLIRHFFSPREQAQILPQSPAHRLDSFFRTWTRKEAFIKAIGEGLSHPTQTFTVPTGPAPGLDAGVSPPLPLALDEDAGETPHWRLYDCTVDPAYPSAVVVGAGANEPLHITHQGRLV